MKNKSQITLIKTDMFSEGIVILMGKKDILLYEKLLRKLIKIDNKELEELKENYREGEDANGYVAMLSDGGKWQMVIFVCEKDWKSTIVHESLHVVEKLCKYRNIPICNETEELRAMMISHIFNEINKSIKIK